MTECSNSPLTETSSVSASDYSSDGERYSGGSFEGIVRGHLGYAASSILFPVFVQVLNLTVFPVGVRRTVSDVVQAVTATTATLLLVFAVRKLRREQATSAYGWAWIMAAHALFAIGMIGFFFVEVIQKKAPYPGLPDIFFLAVYPVMIRGLLTFPVERHGRHEQWNSWLDWGALVLVSAMFVWHLNLRLIIDNLHRSWAFGPLLSLAYTVLDTLLLLSLLHRLTHHLGEGRRFVPMACLLMGGVCLIIADLLQGYVSNVSAFVSGSPIDLGWTLFSAFSGLAAVYLLRFGNRYISSVDTLSRLKRIRSIGTFLLTYFWIVLTLAMLLWAVFNPERATGWVIGIGVFGALLLAITRQLRDVNERARLYERLQRAHDELELRVRERTFALEKQTELLRNSERRFRDIVETTHEWIWTMDVHGAFSYCNPAILAILGYLPEEFLTLGHQCLHADEREKMAKFLSECCRERRGWAREILRWVHRDGSMRILESDGLPISNEQGDVVGFQGANRDITERHWAEIERQRLNELLIHAQKMEAVGQLAGGVAHDFNNILTSLLLNADFLRQSTEGEGKIQDEIKDLELGLKRAANLTRQLLLFSRRQALEPRRLEFNGLLTDLLKMLVRLIGEQVKLNFLPASTPLWIDGDPGMLEQVVVNLVVNARDAMPQGGKITLESSRVDWRLNVGSKNPQARSGRFIRLAVTDTGCGMSIETVNRIFEPFFTTKPQGQGTGLGLSTVYGIVQQHNGWLEVTSVPSRGSQFVVYLPEQDVQVGSVEVDSKPLSQSRLGESILIVEDEDYVRRALVMSLSRLGYKTFEATNAIEALENWKKINNCVRLVVTDVIMPGGMDGFQLAEKLREQEPSLKIIFVSGYNSEVADQGFVRQKGTSYLQKPFIMNEFAHVVRGLLDEN